MNYLTHKKKLKIAYFFLAVSCVFLACAKKYTLETLPKTQLHFGEGGGFTGRGTDYLLLENGQVFKKEPFGKAHENCGKIKPKLAKSFYQQVLGFQQLNLNKSSNQYQFIELKKDSTSHRLMFSNGLKKDSITTSLLQLHETMMKAMPK